MMQGLRLRLEGEPKTIYISALSVAVNNWVKVLSDLDSGISGEPKGSLDWVVSNLASNGSLVISAEYRSRLEQQNFGPRVSEAAINGFRLLEYEGLTPPYLSEAGIGYAKRMVKLVGNQGVSGIGVENTSESVQLSARASVHIDQLLPVRHSTLGSVEGKLEMISIHGKRPQFLVYHHRTHKAIRCTFSTEMLDRVKDALGERVIAMGQVHLNGKNEPVRVDLQQLRVLRAEKDLPSIADITGIDPDFTGELSTAEFLRSIRGG